MLHAHAQGMTKGDYVYIAPTLLPRSNMETPWKTGDPIEDAIAREAYQPLLQVFYNSIEVLLKEYYKTENR